MKLEEAQRIKAVWDRIEESEPDISTEQLLERAREELGFDDIGQITDALWTVHQHEGRDTSGIKTKP